MSNQLLSQLNDAGLEQLATEHLLAHQKTRKLAEFWINYLISNPAKADIKLVEKWARVLDMAIKGERVAARLDLLDINKAVEYLIAYGYEIIDPRQALPEDADETLGDSGGSAGGIDGGDVMTSKLETLTE
jgi:hypothetical protein